MPDPMTVPPAMATDPAPRAGASVPDVSTIGGYTLAIAKTLDHYGVDARRIFAACGVPAVMVNDPMSRLPSATLGAVYKMCVDVTHDPYFGLAVARFIHVSNLHALGHAMAASSTLMDVCRRVVRYFRLVSQTADLTLEESGDQVILRARTRTMVCGETEDAFFGFLIWSMRQLHRASFKPVSMAFHHPVPREGGAPYEQLFQAPVSFSAAETTLVLPRAELEQPLAGACPELAQYNDKIAIDYLARLDKGDVIARLRHKIVEYLPDGECTRDRIARALGMSETSLQGKLRRRGTSYHAVFDETRRELACAYVQQPARAMTEIAFLLGFTDSSNFTRSFKRWTGLSPTEYRRRA